MGINIIRTVKEDLQWPNMKLHDFAPGNAQSIQKNAGFSIMAKSALLFSDGDFVEISAIDIPLHIILFSAPQVKESVAWGGPIVMNTEKKNYAKPSPIWKKATSLKKSHWFKNFLIK